MPRNAATRELEHSGDVGIEVVAATREELFAEAIAALGRIMYDADRVEDRERRKLPVLAATDADLMHDALARALNVFLIDAFVWRDANVIATSGGIEAELIGEPFDRTRHWLHEELKAVTYHRLAVERTPAGWRAVVIFDA
jgi:SHS2 domain-containing protein